ncbi:MAG: PHP domain-containing protein [Cytophagales bacterium]|nr:PHP domain-containing protein [Cytophagales bacterium]
MYLNCHTGFSFKYGTLPIKTLFEEAKRCGVHKLAITEINNVSSYLDMPAHLRGRISLLKMD